MLGTNKLEKQLEALNLNMVALMEQIAHLIGELSETKRAIKDLNNDGQGNAGRTEAND